MKSNKKESFLPLISVLILTHNRKTKLTKAIESVQTQSYPKIEIIVIDNASEDGTSDYIKEIFPKISVISLETNHGCPGGRNIGIDYCAGEYIFFLDDDGILDDKAVENAYNTFFSIPNVGVVTGRVMESNENFMLKNKKSIYEVGLFQGGISLHHVSIYNIIGKYPQDYFYGGEESYLSYKMIENDIKIVKNEEVILYHPKNHPIQKRDQQKKSFENAFLTSYQLFPIALFIVYTLYYSFFYSFYSIKQGFFLDFFSLYFNALKRIKKYKRTPLKYSTILKFHKLNRPN